MLGRNADAHVDMVWHQMAFHDPTLPLPRQLMQHLTQMLPDRPEDRLLAPLRNEYNVVLTVPLRVSKALVISHWVPLSLGRDRRFPMTASHGQTSRSPPAKPGDYLVLFIVDAGLDRQSLRTRYPARQRYAIVRGTVSAYVDRDRVEWTGEGADTRPQNQRWIWRLRGHAEVPVAHSIQLPQRWHATFESLPPQQSQPGRSYARQGKVFSAEVAFGKRLEPWITQLQERQP